ncbi:hypothetical protein [Streptomyces sp. NPDC002611]
MKQELRRRVSAGACPATRWRARRVVLDGVPQLVVVIDRADGTLRNFARYW